MASTISTRDTSGTDRHGGRFRIPRSRGAVSGLLLLLLGIWVAAIPFFGPLFDFGYTPDTEFDMTRWRFWYELLPGVVAAVGGLLLLVAANRAATLLGAWLAVVAGAWLIVGPTLAPLLPFGDITGPIPKSSETATVLETLLLFTGVGAAILSLGSIALGRLSVVSLRDVRAAEERDGLGQDRDDVRREPAVVTQPAQPVQATRTVAPTETFTAQPVQPVETTRVVPTVGTSGTAGTAGTGGTVGTGDSTGYAEPTDDAAHRADGPPRV